jgi:cytochrome c oxidase cbb3-type subunit IV
MDTYSLMREFADSWAMLMIFLVFVGIVIWVFRPGSRAVQDDIANSIFRHDKKPAAEAITRTPRVGADRQAEEA